MIGNLIGGLKAVRDMRAVRSSLEKELRHEIDRRNRAVGEDPTRRSDAQRMLGELDRALKERTRRAEGRAAMTGGVGAHDIAVTQQINSDAMAKATADIAASGEARRERADEEYERRRREIVSRRRELLGIDAREAVKAGGLL